MKAKENEIKNVFETLFSSVDDQTRDYILDKFNFKISFKEDPVEENEYGIMEVVDSKEYTIFDSQNLLHLLSKNGARDVDLGKFLKIALTANRKNNIAWDDSINKPYTHCTLMKYLGFKKSSKATYFNFIKKLVKAGMIIKEKNIIDKRNVMVFAVNPYLARRNKKFDASYLSKFKKDFVD